MTPEEDRYVHQPDGPPDSEPPESIHVASWLLVGALFVAFFVVPATILYLPYAGSMIESLGLTFRDAYLVLPLIPGFVLALIAVWSAVVTQSRAE
ncbi:hypothetical protein [Halocatena halophila]|uniref:hypothetical protein n=1 Tax=Halocatena halophila TaxID=2814576 RepID=UPI002ED6709F